jgi:RIO kinase 1
MKVPERLEPLVEHGLVDEVVRPLMSGKEASLFIVQSNGQTCVAKVYKHANDRSFRQRSIYAEGRKVRNSRQQRAMDKGSRFGKQANEEAWHNAEVDALHRLRAAGVRVPQPRLYSDGVLLMELIVDSDGQPAPRLADRRLDAHQARAIFHDLLGQVVRMLCAGLVHGDLSECNVLLAGNGPVIIDFPQTFDAARNTNAARLFIRDVDNLTRYLSRFAPELEETRYGREVWALYERAELFVDTPLTGRVRDSDKKANVAAVLDEVNIVAREAALRRLSEIKRAEREAQAAAARVAKPSPQRHPAQKHPPQKHPAEKHPAEKKTRSRRRRRRR